MQSEARKALAGTLPMGYCQLNEGSLSNASKLSCLWSSISSVLEHCSKNARPEPNIDDVLEDRMYDWLDSRLEWRA